VSQHVPIFVFTNSTKSSYGYNGYTKGYGFQEAKVDSVFSISCPYCQLHCETEREAASYGVTGWVEDWFACCPRCGWWSYKSDSDDTDGNPTHHSIVAIMKKFYSDSSDIPIDPLVSYIAKHQDLIKNIHPAKLEELVGAYYSEVLGYKVERCSYARQDKGIDLILVNATEGRTLAIQVKRHKRPIELSMIHQFFGAMVDDDRKEGGFITSGRFRSGAVATADSLIEKTDIKIDLADGKRLLEFIGIMNQSRPRPQASDFPFWMSHVYFGKR
jgi:hypothetical protein